MHPCIHAGRDKAPSLIQNCQQLCKKRRYAIDLLAVCTILFALNTVQFALSFSFWKRFKLPVTGDGALLPSPWIPGLWTLKNFLQVFLICIMLSCSKLGRDCCHFYPYCYRYVAIVFSKPVVSLDRTRSQQCQTFLTFMGKEFSLKTMFFTSLKTSIFLL